MATFANSQTVGQLTSKGISLNIIRNPKTGLLFVTDQAGNKLGAISEKCSEQVLSGTLTAIPSDWVLSDFTGDDGKEFKMLHTQAQNNLLLSSAPMLSAKPNRVLDTL